MFQKMTQETLRDIFTRAVNNKWCKRRREKNFRQFSYGRPGINCPKDDPGNISEYFYTVHIKCFKKRCKKNFGKFLYGWPTINDAKDDPENNSNHFYTGGPQQMMQEKTREGFRNIFTRAAHVKWFEKKAPQEFRPIFIRAARNKCFKRWPRKHFETFLHGRSTINDAKEDARRILGNFHTGGPE